MSVVNGIEIALAPDRKLLQSPVSSEQVRVSVSGAQGSRDLRGAPRRLSPHLKLRPGNASLGSPIAVGSVKEVA